MSAPTQPPLRNPRAFGSAPPPALLALPTPKTVLALPAPDPAPAPQPPRSSTSLAAGDAGWLGGLVAVYRDLRVRHGIKTGLAALLALWITQLLRLEHPNWSVLGVLVLSNTYYVGAVASRALMRSLGTVCGALVGIWAVGDYANDPPRFLLIVIVVVTVAVYQYGRLAASAWPYAYYLVGLTLTSVATYGVADPANIWRSALQRVLETLVAVFCATFVTALVWPRHASEEFASAAAEALRTVRHVLLARVHQNATAASGDANVALDNQILRLRTLLLTGGRGSIRFHASLGNLQQFLVTLTRLRHAALGLEQPAAWLTDAGKIPSAELRNATEAMGDDLAALADMAATGRVARMVWLDAAYRSLEARLRRTLAGEGGSVLLTEQEAISGYLAAWRQIRDELRTLHDILGKFPRRNLQPVRSGGGLRWPTLDPAWLLISLKSGVSVCLAFALLRWVHPPGGSAVPVSALLCTAGGRYSLLAGGRGDLRVLQMAFLSLLLGLPVLGLCWLLLPALTNYWAMNVTLFALCFGLSFTMARVPLFTFGRLVAVLSISTLVALDPNAPISFQALMDAYMGLMVGVGLGALVSRVLWPVLPQGILRGHMIRFFDDLRRLLAESEGETYILSQTAALPVEAMQAVGQMALPGCPSGERDRLVRFVQTIQPLGLQISALRTAADRANKSAELSVLRLPLRELIEGIDSFLATMGRCFRLRDERLGDDGLGPLLAGIEAAWERLHDNARVDGEQSGVALESLNQCRVVVARLQAGGRQLGELHLRCYLGDVAL